MGKKQILKNIEKDKKDTTIKEEKDGYFKFITTLAILLIVFLISYFALGLFYTKEIDLKKKTKETKDEVNIDNNTIMLGQLFDQAKNEYYVLIYDLNDEESSMPNWKSTYESSDGALSIYVVDSSKKFNSQYIVKENSNKNATSLSDLKVISPTLIKVNNKSITEYIEGEDNIVNKFKGN